uniref:vitamin-K-epoxide reductase (warfarin-sensitive) n=1 Tax=Hirondellea gigas TaxID=1518452 RepID=A0A2P2I346_9CRUS
MHTSKVLSYSRLLNTILSFLGIMLSVYAVYVEVKKEEDSDYVALCDITEIISCSKVFSTKYAKGFGVIGPIFGEESILNQPNGIYGTACYIILLILSQVRWTRAAHAQLLLVVLCNCTTPYLAYLLYKVIKAVCVLCLATYAVNFSLLLVALWRRTALLEVQDKRTGRLAKRE